MLEEQKLLSLSIFNSVIFPGKWFLNTYAVLTVHCLVKIALLSRLC